MSGIAARVAAAFETACRDELEVLKPGNVHVFAPGHRMTAAMFVASAEAAAPHIAATGARVGVRIRAAVAATFASVGANTNLGIVLLCAPLAAAAERGRDLRAALGGVLAGLDRADAEGAFAAIRQAAPRGLGRAERHDVATPPRVTLREAMEEAAPRDMIARQYADGFAQVFGIGLPALREFGAPREPGRATLGAYLSFLAAFPDTHVARGQGAMAAEGVRLAAAPFLARLRRGETLAALHADLAAWDKALKGKGLNPGTSADLTVATLFAQSLQSSLRRPGNSD